MAIFGFGLISFFPKDGSYDKTFFVVALLSRFTQGLGDALVTVAAFSIITIEFPEDKEKYIGWMQTCCGLGLLLGPVIGQGVYVMFGKVYEDTFYFLGGLMIACVIVATILLPNRLNKARVEQETIEKIVHNSVRQHASIRMS